MPLNDEINSRMGGSTLTVTGAHAHHLCPPLKDFEKMSDAELSQITLGIESPDEMRARLKAARNKGYSFLPCGCADPKPTGECPGWIPKGMDEAADADEQYLNDNRVVFESDTLRVINNPITEKVIFIDLINELSLSLSEKDLFEIYDKVV